MMTRGQRKRLNDAMAAVENFDRRFRSPRRLEAALDAAFTALHKLSDMSKHIKTSEGISLYALLCDLSQAKLVAKDAVTACRELEDLAETADYGDPDEDDFGDECEIPLETVRRELSSFLGSLDEKKHQPG